MNFLSVLQQLTPIRKKSSSQIRWFRSERVDPSCPFWPPGFASSPSPFVSSFAVRIFRRRNCCWHLPQFSQEQMDHNDEQIHHRPHLRGDGFILVQQHLDVLQGIGDLDLSDGRWLNCSSCRLHQELLLQRVSQHLLETVGPVTVGIAAQRDPVC